MRLSHAVNAAMEQAARAPGTYRHGCVLLRKGRILAAGYNTFKRHGRYTTHAELAALRRTRGAIDAAVVVRLNMTGGMTLSRPCSMCMAALVRCGASRLFYSTADGSVVRELPPSS